MNLQLQYQTPTGREVVRLPTTGEQAGEMLKRLARRHLRARLLALHNGERITVGGVEPYDLGERVSWLWWNALTLAVEEGDLLVTSAKSLRFYLRQNGEWVRQASWTLVDLVRLCEECGYTKREHMPPLNMYGGLYRKGGDGPA